MSCIHPNRSLLQPLSSVPHTAASLIKDHITPTLKQLHWLSIRARIAFKISPSSCNVNRPTKYSRLLWLRSVAVVDLVYFSLLVYHIYMYSGTEPLQFLSAMVTP